LCRLTVSTARASTLWARAMLLEAFSVDGTLARVLLDTLGSAASSMVQVGELIEKARYSQPTVIRRLLSKDLKARLCMRASECSLPVTPRAGHLCGSAASLAPRTNGLRRLCSNAVNAVN
jgi:hypothetical protein